MSFFGHGCVSIFSHGDTMNHPLPKTAGQTACAAVITSGLLPACAVGPNFKAPEAPRNAGFATAGQIAPATAAAPLPGGQAQRFVDGMDIPGQWWTLFRSPQLNALIERALENSPTLQAAQAALRQANETAAAQRGAYYPSLSGTAQSERQKGSGAALGIPGLPSSYFYDLQTASVSVSYTLDAFGGTRRQVEAQEAQAEYQQFALEASYLTLTANIVAAAVNEASLRAQISATEDISRSQQMQLDIAQRRFTAGAASRADVLQQQATLQATLATLPPLRSQLAQQRNQLAAYIGDFPSNYTGPNSTSTRSTCRRSCRSASRRNSSSSVRTCVNTRRCCIRPPPRSGLPRPICCRRSRSAQATVRMRRSGRTYSHRPRTCTASSPPSRSRFSKADSSSTSDAPPWPPRRKRPPTIRPPSSPHFKTYRTPCTRCRVTRMRSRRKPPPSAARRTALPWFKHSTRAAAPAICRC